MRERGGGSTINPFAGRAFRSRRASSHRYTYTWIRTRRGEPENAHARSGTRALRATSPRNLLNPPVHSVTLVSRRSVSLDRREAQMFTGNSRSIERSRALRYGRADTPRASNHKRGPDEDRARMAFQLSNCTGARVRARDGSRDGRISPPSMNFLRLRENCHRKSPSNLSLSLSLGRFNLGLRERERDTPVARVFRRFFRILGFMNS